MSEWKSLELTDAPLYRAHTSAAPSQNAWLSFGMPYLWDVSGAHRLWEAGGCLAVEWRGTEKPPFFTFPVGAGDLTAAVDALRRHAAGEGRRLTFRYVDEDCRAALEAACPGQFVFTEDRGAADYLYGIDALSTLSGKRLHAKRNFCNRFEKSHDWRAEPVTGENFDGCRAVFARWAEGREATGAEHLAIERAFAGWEALGLEGCVLYDGEEPIAFAVGELLREDTFDVHFEKAVEHIPGAYPMICREFARQVAAAHPLVRYVNREEDMDLPNLRQAKESWFPCSLLKKYVAEEKTE